MASIELYRRSGIEIPPAPTHVTNGLAQVSIEGAIVYFNQGGLNLYADPESKRGAQFLNSIVGNISAALGDEYFGTDAYIYDRNHCFNGRIVSPLENPEEILKTDHDEHRACIVGALAVLISSQDTNTVVCSRQPFPDLSSFAYS